MRNNHAAVTAVLTTVLRATADGAMPIVLRTGRPEQAQALAGWLERMHGSRRVVVASRWASGPIQVQLPRRMRWPDRSELAFPAAVPLAPTRPPVQFTAMLTAPPTTGRR
jgi:hypothetical protein